MYSSMFRGRSESPSADNAVYTQLLNAHDQKDDGLMLQTPIQSKLSRRLLFWNILFFSAALLLSITTLVVPSYVYPDKLVAKHITGYSPFLEHFTPSWHLQQNVSEPQPSSGSLFRQDSNPESDKAWSQFNDRGFIGLTRAQVEKMGQDADTVVHRPARELPVVPSGVDPNSDEDVYVGFLDAIHLVHCLSMMRQALVFNYDRYYPDGMTEIQHGHLAHCQESLIQALTCRPSLEVIPAVWMENQRYFWSDFDSSKQCMDWNAVMRWQAENRIDSKGHEGESFTKKYLAPPEGAKRRKSAVLNDERLYKTFPAVGKVQFE